ncbi:MAG: leucine-rich repeat protein, partial [Bacteroides sp.]|nr:leucine-rich repeat protein [Bacteroides sp.]
MEDYPLISEYKEAIMSPEDNFSELTSLRPVLDSRGEPVMSSGNFAVVFKMRDEKTGKLYAIKCFTRPQEGRAESYRRITEELESVASAYMIPMRWLDNELFVDTTQCDREEFPVVVMDWVEGEPLDLYVSRHLDDTDALSMLSYRFNRMAAWLLAQPFVHGDLKPDNIFVRPDSTLTLIDYDSMFVPSMQGEKARETGNPDYYNPMYTDDDFNEHIADFSIVVIALSLKALSLNPALKNSASADTLLLSEADFRDPANSRLLPAIALLTTDPELTLLLDAFYIALAKKSLDLVSLRLFMTQKPKLTEKLSTAVTKEDIANGVEDEYGVIYSKDGKLLLKCKNRKLTEYTVKDGTKVICNSAFYYAFFGLSLQSINIPSSITAIGDSAFNRCKVLQSVNIPSSVTTIGINPFSGCKNLQINLSHNSHFRIIDNLLISDNGNLISCLNTTSHVNIPSSVTTIGDSAFCGCSALQSVNIPSSVTAVGDSAFCGCSALQSVNIPSSVTTIGDSAFCRCEALQSINIPSSVTAVGNSAFCGCSALQSVNIPSSVTTIGDSMFCRCTTLQSVNIPSSVTTIGDSAFCGCETLKSINIPSSVTAIGNSVFRGCSALQSIDIPSSVTAIGDSAFEYCRTLQSINIPSSVATIGDSAFCECSALKSINIPSSVTTIGNSTFEYCRALQSINIPSSVTTIGNSAFSGCSALKSINIPSSVTTIGNSAFCRCSALKSINIPSSVTTIGNSAFRGCSALKSINIPSSVTAIGNSAFCECSALQSVNIPSSVTAVGDSAFCGCSALQSVNIPSSVTAVGTNPFRGCGN